MIADGLVTQRRLDALHGEHEDEENAGKTERKQRNHRLPIVPCAGLSYTFGVAQALTTRAT